MAPGTVVVVDVVELPLLVVVVVTGSVVVDVVVGMVTVVRGFVNASTAEVATSATSTAASADRSTQLVRLPRGELRSGAGPDPPPLAPSLAAPCRPSTTPTSCGFYGSSTATVVPSCAR